MSKYSRKFHGEEHTSTAPEHAPLSTTASPSPTEGVASGSGRRRLQHRGPRTTSRADAGSSPSSEPLAAPAEQGAADAAQQTAPPREPATAGADTADLLSDEADIDLEYHHQPDDRLDGAPSEVNAAPQHLYACDLCPHLVFSSPDALEQHALHQHGDVVPDYVKLREVSARLVPLWEQVRSRKAAVIRMWGRKIFHIAKQRDAGPEKMVEAHRAREQLEHVVRRWHANARVFVFGSSVTLGVWDGIADIDFTVVDVDEMDAGTWPPPEKNAVRSITELLRRAGFSYVNLEPIPYARVPIIKHHASSPIRLPTTVAHRQRHQTRDAQDAGEEQPQTQAEQEEASRLEAEDVISRSVRYVLSSPASRQDRVVLEGSIRDAVGADAIQQVWWNRTGEMMCITCDTTLNAIRAATCGLSFVTPGMRARVQPLHDECRPELYNIDFDLSFRAFGIRNSELLNRYLTSHPCARAGAIVLKDWSKTSGVNNSMNGYLTSYAVNIMWIYFLTQKGVVPYVDPLLDVAASLVGRTSFGPTYRPMLPPELTDEELEALYGKAGELLLGFFYFYAHEFDWRNHVVSLNRKGITTKKMLGWDQEDSGASHSMPAASMAAAAATTAITATGPTSGKPVGGSGAVQGIGRKAAAARYTFCIEDPYEENLNLGRHMGITKALRVQTELHRGLLSLLKDGEHNSCVFASTDRSEAAAAEQRDGGNAAHDATAPQSLLSTPSSSPPASQQPAGRLPMKVLYRLMAISMKEIARAKREAGGALREGSSATAETREGSAVGLSPPPAPTPRAASPSGLRSEQLQAAFRREASLEYQLACKAWNWEQLVHRLGYKLHQGFVVPRREVGVRRLSAHPQPPRGVLPAASVSPTPSPPGSDGAAPGGLLAPSQRPLGLSERMAVALTEGFLKLTPEWVAWSTPWAALHLRGYTFFTPRTSGEARQPPPPSSPAPSSREQGEGRAVAPAAGSAGAMKRTPQRQMRWLGPLPMAPSARAPLRFMRALLHK